MSPNIPDLNRATRASGPSRNRQAVRSILTWSLIIGAGIFLTHILAPEIQVLRRSMAVIAWPQVVLAAIAAIPMYLIKGCYHLSLLDRIGTSRGSWRKDLPIYLQAQIVRYLPGKIWGIVYQSQRMSGNHQSSAVVVANLWQMATTNFLAAGLVISLLLALRYSYAWALLLIPVVIAVEWLHRHPAMETWALKQLARFLPRLVPLAGDGPLPPMPWKGTAMLCSEWIFYFLAFACMLHDLVDWHSLFLIATWYGGASLLALAAFVVPAGIAVREAIFIAAPQVTQADAATLAITAALARLVFLGSEISAALFASVLNLGRRHERQ
ncbi:hypothetical protein [Lysobacter capsici]|nr:hypothetical protein [Lysobacter capsici]